MASIFKTLVRKKSMRLKLTVSSINMPGKRLSHHSFSIITQSGHRQEQSVEAYDSRNEDEQRQLSNIIHSLTANRSRLESEQVEVSFSLSTSSSLPQLAVAKFTIPITVMWLSTRDRLMEFLPFLVSSSLPSM